MINRTKNIIYRILRQSEKWIGTDMVYVAKGGSWLLGGNALTAISSLLLAVAFANLLPQETYGTYKYVISTMFLLGIPLLSGLNTAVMQAATRGYDQVLVSAIKTKIRWSILTVIGGSTLSLYYFFQEDVRLGGAFLVIAILYPIAAIANTYITFLEGKKYFNKVAQYKSFDIIISSLVMFVTILLTKNLILILLAYLVPLLVIRSLLLFITVKKYVSNSQDSKDSILYGKQLTIINIINQISGSIDNILLFHLLGPIQLAIYSFARAPLEQSRVLFKTIGTLAFPKLAANDINTIRKTLPRKLLKLAVLALLFVGFYVLVAPYIYRTILPQYVDSIFYSQIMMLALVLAPKNLLHTTLLAHSKKHALLTRSIVVPLFRIISLVILIPIYGIMGAVITELAQNLLGGLLLFYLFMKSER